MEGLLESDQAVSLFPLLTPGELGSLGSVSWCAYAQLSRRRPWACWIEESDSVVGAEHFATFSRLKVSPTHVLCLAAPGNITNKDRALVLAHTKFPRARRTGSQCM